MLFLDRMVRLMDHIFHVSQDRVHPPKVLGLTDFGPASRNVELVNASGDYSRKALSSSETTTSEADRFFRVQVNLKERSRGDGIHEMRKYREDGLCDLRRMSNLTEFRQEPRRGNKIMKNGWGTGTRTPIDRSRDCRPAIRRSPSF